MSRLAYFYGWLWFHLMLKGPRRLWNRPRSRTRPWREDWTALALHAFVWAGTYAHWDYSKMNPNAENL